MVAITINTLTGLYSISTVCLKEKVLLIRFGLRKLEVQGSFLYSVTHMVRVYRKSSEPASGYSCRKMWKKDIAKKTRNELKGLTRQKWSAECSSCVFNLKVPCVSGAVRLSSFGNESVKWPELADTVT